MSKLDNNERWQSKMLLTEHQEQYDAREQPKEPGRSAREEAKPAGRPTPDELTLIRDYVLLPHLLTMIQNSLDRLQSAPNLLNRLFLMAGQIVADCVSQDMYGLRRELKRRNIRIVDEEQVDLIVYHRYVCRGYEERFGIVREVMKAEISMRLARYLGDIGRRLQQPAERKSGEQKAEEPAVRSGR